MPVFIGLLRGVNVGGRNRVPMADLRARCEDAGLLGVQTCLQSGNIVLESGGAAGEVELLVERVLADSYGVAVPVVARTAEAWNRCVEANPFPDAAAGHPSQLHLCLCKQPPAPDAADLLEAKSGGGERVAVVENALWIDYASGVGRSKLTPTVLDRALGSPATARNWNTVLKVEELVRRMTA